MDHSALINREWPEWKIVSLLGNGSYGSVYLAEKYDGDTVLRSAIKTVCIPSYPIEDASSISQQQKNDYCEIVGAFRSEIHTMELLKSAPNIVSIEDFKVVQQPNGVGWAILIRMEYLNSLDFSNMEEKDIIQLGCDICTALDMCEKNGIMHRDIKPGNILNSKHGGYKLGDFGISRMMEKDTIGSSLTVGVGTPDFMAPEVAKNLPYDHRADIYSVGLVLFYALNEQRMPFLPSPKEKQILNMSERREAYLRRITEHSLPRPIHGSDALVAVIQKACFENPDDRFSTAEEMKEALWALNGTPSEKNENNKSKRRKTKKEKKPKSKKRKIITVIAIILSIIIAFFGVTEIFENNYWRWKIMLMPSGSGHADSKTLEMPVTYPDYYEEDDGRRTSYYYWGIGASMISNDHRTELVQHYETGELTVVDIKNGGRREISCVLPEEGWISSTFNSSSNIIFFINHSTKSIGAFDLKNNQWTLQWNNLSSLLNKNEVFLYSFANYDPARIASGKNEIYLFTFDLEKNRISKCFYVDEKKITYDDYIHMGIHISDVELISEINGEFVILCLDADKQPLIIDRECRVISNDFHPFADQKSTVNNWQGQLFNTIDPQAVDYEMLANCFGHFGAFFSEELFNIQQRQSFSSNRRYFLYTFVETNGYHTVIYDLLADGANSIVFDNLSKEIPGFCFTKDNKVSFMDRDNLILQEIDLLSGRKTTVLSPKWFTEEFVNFEKSKDNCYFTYFPINDSYLFTLLEKGKWYVDIDAIRLVMVSSGGKTLAQSEQIPSHSAYTDIFVEDDYILVIAAPNISDSKTLLKTNHTQIAKINYSIKPDGNIEFYE